METEILKYGQALSKAVWVKQMKLEFLGSSDQVFSNGAGTGFVVCE